jgi:hypothetical protein
VRGRHRRVVAAARSELRAALVREVPVRVRAAPTKPGYVSTARWRRSGERDGEEYARNRCCKAPQRYTDSNLVDAGREQRVTAAVVVVEELPGVVKPVTGRLRGKACGVLVARLLWQSRAPPSSREQQ